MTIKRPNHSTMRKLTPMQLETLTAFYYGEVLMQLTHKFRKPGPFVEYLTYNDVLTGRVRSLFKRKLLRRVNSVNGDWQAVIVTPAGIKEMEAIDA